MPQVTIRCRANGPLLVEGPVKVVDSDGNAFVLPADKPALALCRCGQSARRPFCDGSHNRCQFVADEKASPAGA